MEHVEAVVHYSEAQGAGTVTLVAQVVLVEIYLTPVQNWVLSSKTGHWYFRGAILLYFQITCNHVLQSW